MLINEITKEEFEKSIKTKNNVFSYETEEEWNLLREKRIGGSDIGAILGVNKWRSAIDVFIDKTRGSTFEGNDATYWGNTLEPIVREEFAKRHSELTVFTAPYSVASEYLIANLDGVLKDENGEYGVLEIKTANAFAKSDWEEDVIPQSYYAQVQHYLMMTGYKYAYIAVLIGGQIYKEFKIERSEEDIKLIAGEANRFYFENITLDMPPPVDGTSAYMEYLKEKAEKMEEINEVELDQLEEKAEKLAELSLKKKEIEEEENFLKQEIFKELVDNNSLKAKCGSFSFSIQSKSVTDKVAFEKTHPDIFKTYKELEKGFKKQGAKFLVVKQL